MRTEMSFTTTGEKIRNRFLLSATVGVTVAARGEKSTNRTPTAALRRAMLTTIGISLLVAATLLWAAISNTQAALAVA